MILSFRTNRYGQTVQTQISADPDQTVKEQSDQRFLCLLFYLHLFDEIPEGFAPFLKY